jgi:hypothetical protein
MTTANLRRNRPEPVSNIRPLRPVPSGPRAFAETAVYWKIRQAARLAARTGGIVWLTGPPGIGKTHCLENRLEQDAEGHGIALHRIALTHATGKNLRAFAALFTGHRAFTGADAAGDIEGRWLNLSHRFGMPPRRAVAIIDEAQFAGLDVMGTLRGIWDSWEPERRAARCEGRAPVLARAGDDWQPGFCARQRCRQDRGISALGRSVADPRHARRTLCRGLRGGGRDLSMCGRGKPRRCWKRLAPSWSSLRASRRRIASPPRSRPPGSCPARPRSKRQSKRIGG